ncbi:alpha/beta hydrolase [Arthrobacter antioxidans]|uniref:alpha/beta hydrolase n=1 Tax=Arthrobacter antioxidans TaxID=2895818 RepID=UPI001FFF46F0|nr:alpha/beta hydrolase [Arthrobacter antioxidans]
MRPTDWFPLTGGDPAPGNPAAWQQLVRFLLSRRDELNDQAHKLGSHLPVEGSGNRIENLRAMLAGTQIFASRLAEQFDTAAETFHSWRNTLDGLQVQSAAALSRAQAAQEDLESARASITALEEEAARDSSWDPLIGLELDGMLWIDGHRDAAVAAEKVIAEQQQFVDQLRVEYRDKAAAMNTTAIFRDLDALDVTMYSSASAAAQAITNSDVDLSVLEASFRSAQYGTAEYKELLDNLSLMTPAQLSTFFLMHPALVSYPVPVSADTIANTAAAKNWWAALSLDQQAALIQFAPGMIGNTEGVTYGARDEANRILLANALVAPTTPEHVRTALRSLDDAAHATNNKSAERYIMSLDLSGYRKRDKYDTDTNPRDDVLAAVAIGNVDTATAVSILTPGMNNDVAGSMSDLTTAAQKLHDQQGAMYLNAGEQADQHAMVAWMGYETPPPSLTAGESVLGDHLARQGGDRLARTADGLNITRNYRSTLNLVGHSYGTTTTGEALRIMETKADTVTLLASAGVTEGTVDQANDGSGLAVESDSAGNPNIFYTQASSDNVAGLGVFGSGRDIPDDIDGSTEFSAGGGYDTFGNYYGDTDAHDLYGDDESPVQGYLSSGTSSLYYAALTSTGHGESMGQLVPTMVEWKTTYRGDVYSVPREHPVTPAQMREAYDYTDEEWKQLSNGETR